MLITGLWAEFETDGYWKTTGTAGILAVAFAHALLLALPDLDPRQLWVQWLAAGSIVVLAAQILIAASTAIRAEEGEWIDLATLREDVRVGNEIPKARTSWPLGYSPVIS